MTFVRRVLPAVCLVALVCLALWVKVLTWR